MGTAQAARAVRAEPAPDALALDAKRPFIQRLFTRIAPRYDWFNRLASCGLDRRWRRQTLAWGDVGPGQRVLDVCAGTGDLALLCARRQRGDSPAMRGRWRSQRGAAPGEGEGTVVGIDLNREMLARAQRKQRARRLPVSWVEGDAEALPFPDGSFDRVLIGFSTRNLSDLMGGLREMVRVLRPGGRLLILETGRPRHPVVRAGYQLFLFTAARAIGFLLTGRVWPFTYLARSVQRFLAPEEMVARLASLNTEARYVPLSHGLASLYLAVKR
ncbi:MAG: ubiquinone/menaquinone biosynthesis methyltransferase [Candidatus Omnitrophica bacterium]|nr:ubiquinone/menaquinone biosynthesis methyltransferase [Candidatus Omnitrophota bacterium]